MYVPEPRRTWLDLRWRLFGVSVRVHPFFWVVAAALGWGFYAEPDRGGLGLLGLWIVCTLFSVLVHEFGQVAAARLFGARLHIVLYALGGLAAGLDAIKSRGQRLAVLLAGPLAQGILLGGLWALTSERWPFPSFLRERPWTAELAANGLYMLFLINLSWLVLNLLPIWPLDGGFITWEVCEWLLGPRGHAVSLGVCLFVTGLVGLRIGQAAHELLPYRYDSRFGVDLQQYGILLLFCALLIGSGFQALRAERRHYREQLNPG